MLLGTDFGEGSLAESGYPRLVKRWRRGQPLDEAETVFSAASTDVVVAASVDRTPGFERTMIARAVDFFNNEIYELRGGELIRIDAPTDATVSAASRLAADRAAHRLGRVWQYVAGSLLAANYDEFLAGTHNCEWCSSPTSTPACTTTRGRGTGSWSSRWPMSPAGSRS